MCFLVLIKSENSFSDIYIKKKKIFSSAIRPQVIADFSNESSLVNILSCILYIKANTSVNCSGRLFVGVLF